jgi:hypothetical protein
MLKQLVSERLTRFKWENISVHVYTFLFYTEDKIYKYKNYLMTVL